MIYAAAWAVTSVGMAALAAETVGNSLSPLQALLVGCAAGAAPTAAAAFLNRKKVRADITSEITAAAREMIRELRVEVADAKQKADQASRMEHECQHQLALLRLEVAALTVRHKASGGE